MSLSNSRRLLLRCAAVLLAGGGLFGPVLQCLSPFGPGPQSAKAWAGADEPQAVGGRIEQLIEQLGDPSYIKRQSAKAQLESIGLLAFENLRNATTHPNIEIASSAQYLLQSMRVVWTLPTDSFEVQRLLKDYNEFRPSQRLDRMQRLARLHRADGYLALLRLVRYESHENLSKIAALHVMDAAIDDSPQGEPLPMAELVRSSLGDSSRVSAAWLRQLLRVLDGQSRDLQPWQQFVWEERKLLESNSDKTSETAIKRLYRWTAKWLASAGRRDEAVAFLEPSLELLGKDQSSTLDDVVWMLEEGLPEAVLKLAEQKPELFATRARNRYLLAESYARQGDAAQAERVADEAQNLVRTGIAIQRANGKFDGEAMQRLDLARFLNLRGRYDWAEAELKRAEAMHAQDGYLSDEAELDVRDELALFYWGADQPERAAEALRPILQRAGLLPEAPANGQPPGGKVPNEKAPDSKPPDGKAPSPGAAGQRGDKDLLRVMSEKTAARRGPSFREYVPGSYHFYLGLAAIKAGDLPRARAELRAAIALIGQNPDVLIAMTKVAGDDAEFKAEADRAINRLEQYYRTELVSEEAELVSSTTRQSRLESEMSIATDCNQLAWLLAGTGRKPREAIALSERSLTLNEDSPIYLDTLARCHFSAGNIDKAIQLQSRALALMPYERQMQRQLAEFQAAKETAPRNPDAKDSSDKR